MSLTAWPQSSSISSPFPLSFSKPHPGPKTAEYPHTLSITPPRGHSTKTLVPRPEGVTLWVGRLQIGNMAMCSGSHGWLCVCTEGHACFMFIPDSEDSDPKVTAEGSGEYAFSLPLPLHQPPHWMDRLPV